VILVPLAMWMFREHLSPTNLLGMLVAVLGLALMSK